MRIKIVQRFASLAKKLMSVLLSDGKLHFLLLPVMSVLVMLVMTMAGLLIVVKRVRLIRML